MVQQIMTFPNETNHFLETIVGLLQEYMPEDEALLILIDKCGVRHTTDPDRVEALGFEHRFWNDLVVQIEDGHDPVIVWGTDCHVIGMQLSVDALDLGYMVVVLGNRHPDHILMNMDLVQIIWAQTRIIIGLLAGRMSMASYS